MSGKREPKMLSSLTSVSLSSLILVSGITNNSSVQITVIHWHLREVIWSSWVFSASYAFIMCNSKVYFAAPILYWAKQFLKAYSTHLLSEIEIRE